MTSWSDKEQTRRNERKQASICNIKPLIYVYPNPRTRYLAFFVVLLLITGYPWVSVFPLHYHCHSMMTTQRCNEGNGQCYIRGERVIIVMNCHEKKGLPSHEGSFTSSRWPSLIYFSFPNNTRWSDGRCCLFPSPSNSWRLPVHLSTFSR